MNRSIVSTLIFSAPVKATSQELRSSRSSLSRALAARTHISKAKLGPPAAVARQSEIV
jgi:hypothetical protein